MKNCGNFALCFLIATLLLFQAIPTTSGIRCTNISPKWKDLGGAYCYVVEVNQSITWTDAVYQCFLEGGTLASFHNNAELQRVVDEVRGQDVRLYIGLRKNNDGSFQWVDKSPVDFTMWYPGEPNLGNEKCTEIYVDVGKWNDIDCKRESQYVCSTPKRQPARRTRKECPDSSPYWSDFGGEYCYIIESKNKATWFDALSRCVEKGGSLASFHSIEEISAVVQRTKNSEGEFHIGLNDMDEPGRFAWTDMSAMDLDYWGISIDVYTLDDVLIDSERTCGEMRANNGEWLNVWCEKSSGYICSVRKEIICGGDFVSQRGFFQSPNNPEHYGPNEYCEWTITVAENHRISLKFHTFNVEYSKNCRRDFVEIRDGHEATSPVLDKICGSVSLNTIKSTGNKMKVVFSSDRMREFSGFTAEFEEDNCGGDIISDRGNFSSPNFPEQYGKNEDCTWKITVPEDHQVILQFQSFKLEGSADCVFDVVEVRDGHAPNSPVLGKFCFENIPGQIRSSTNKLAVRLLTDNLVERLGFQATFRKIGANEVLVESMLREMLGDTVLEEVRNAKERITKK